MTDHELYQIVGKNIKKFRLSLGMTQQDLADFTQISLSYISKLEASGCSKSISLSLLNQLSTALNIPISHFFKEDI